ncbi:DNA primase [Cognatishimia activa]|uniref:DNA primase n=1 Tax=Cognatishimia activa TaxID=1715691 RepID=A0A0P1IN81_9RHOB|nr:DNA primase [Cognatishimia activa]CUJ14693.1 DNA primase [Cognatishimia activa]CUK25003.1 DNA primase [Cognatishimia activa]
MSITPAFLDELRSRTNLVQVVGRKVNWDNRKSNQGKGDMWAPCPFHHEKTASFHVDDQKGYYYCFGCQAKGDAINFVQETENVSFVDAVKILADEAGLAMPDRDPRAQEKADKRATLVDVMELATRYFRMALRTAAGADARAYLERRGLSQEQLDRWEIGFAPDGWQNLWDALKGKNVPDELILAAGLAKPSTKGGKPYDTFRNRIMFPIRDARGRAIAFGGRAMDPNDNAKYLNSPETELFDKGRNLYNHAPARAAAGKGQPLIVAEGYMDVIALESAGFGGAVAPLGTAVTENQLQLMWRISPEPIIALDGDKAGIRAALRLIDLALPLLQAGQSLRFAIMPEGQDPDDLIKAKGPKAVQAVLDQARPMVDLLWEREIEGKNFDSPERKAALDKALREKIKLIKDPSIRAHYGQTIKDLRWKLFRPAPTGRKGGTFRPGKWAPTGAKGTTKSSLLVSADAARQRHMRESVIVATIIVNPTILDEFEEGLDRLSCEDEDLRFLRDLLLRQAHRGVEDLKSVIEDAMGPEALDFLMGHPHVRIAPPVRRPGDLELARQTVSEELQKLTADAGWHAELAEAEEDLHHASDEAVTWRLGQAAEARNRAQRSLQEDSTEYEVGDNGAAIDKDERAALDALMERIGFNKQDR